MTTIVLVHGAWCDGSSWSDVVPLLQDQGHDVRAVQLPLTSLSDDVATVERALEQASGPLVVGGHSYGGAVVTAAVRPSHDVAALVYVAAYAPDEGETVLSIGERFPATDGGRSIRVTADGWLTLDPSTFPAVFAADVPERRARTMAAVQAPTHGACFGTPLAHVAWRDTRSVFLLSEHDHMVHPDAQADMAARMGATVTVLPTSHASPVSRPEAVAEALHAATIG